jgi:hypothetical protein
MPDKVTTRTRYGDYQAEVTADIEACVQEMGCQPILFVGSGLSRRYWNGPSWDELLGHLATACPLIDKDYAYYKQALPSPLAIGALFAAKYHEWAWSTGRNNFPPDLFDATVHANAYIKHSIAEHLTAMTPRSLDDLRDPALASEIAILRTIQPHAIITTNYDQFLELAFPDYIPIIGQQIIRGASLSIGEIFKIHGCVSQPDSLIFTEADYDEFIKRKKYLSAKLLTYFSEHPLVFIGYGAGDPNIQAILSDIDEALPEAGGVIPNVYMVEWQPDVRSDSSPGKDRLIGYRGC